MTDHDRITTIRPIGLDGTPAGPEVSVGSDDRNILIYSAPTPFDPGARLAIDYRTAALVMMAVCERFRVRELAEELGSACEIESRPLPRMATWADIRMILDGCDVFELGRSIAAASAGKVATHDCLILQEAAVMLVRIAAIAEHGFIDENPGAYHAP